jgi:hemoglobin-like flavoprotein
MTYSEMQIVKASWKAFRAIDPVLVGDVFYTQLFHAYPQLKTMFRTPKEDQAKKLVDMLSIIVGRIDKVEELQLQLEALGNRHVRYGVKPEHYKAVGEALLWTLEQGLGADWNNDVRAAWQACYNEVSTTMLAAAQM